jgi:hypothetical protein
METVRERDLRAAAEEKLKETRAATDSRIQDAKIAMEARLKEIAAAAEDRLKEVRSDCYRESDRLLSELKISNDTIQSLKSEYLKLESMKNSDSTIITNLRQQNQDSAEKINMLLLELKNAEEKFVAQIEDSTRRQTDAEKTSAIKIAELNAANNEILAKLALSEQQLIKMQRDQADEIELHKAAVEAVHIANHGDSETNFLYQQLNDMRKSLSVVSLEKNKLQEELEICNSMLEEQITEINALKLRLELQDTYLGKSLPTEKGSLSKFPPHLPHPSLLSPTHKRVHDKQLTSYGVPSPLFTEDMGSISIPSSPMGQLEDNAAPRQLDGLLGFNVHKNSESFQLHNRRKVSSNHDVELDQLKEENYKLRQNIHEVN